MNGATLLPSQDRWVDDVCEQLIEGARLVVHAPPRMGKSHLAAAVADRLGPTSSLIRGSAFTESNQVRLRDQMRSSLLEAVNTHGNAQLVFDDYHAALRRTHGLRLQSNLVSLLVDGDRSQDLGAIFFARYSTPIHLPGRGSPLMSRCTVISMPRWDPMDLAESGVNAQAADRSIGNSASFLALASIGGGLAIERLARRLMVDGERIIDDLPPAAVQTVGGRADHVSLGDFERRSLDGLWREGNELTEVARTARLDVLAAQRNAGWPSGLDLSARHFAHLMGGRESAIWCDRYAFRQLDVLSEFIARVREYTAVRLRILGTERPGSARVSPEQIREALEKFTNVEARTMRPLVRRQLHDRHLALSGERGGWVVPTADVITGISDSGSAIATRTSTFGVDYEAIWDSSQRVAPA